MIKLINGIPCIIEASEAEHRFHRLSAEWRVMGESAREAIKDEIKRHPEWNLMVTSEGICKR